MIAKLVNNGSAFETKPNIDCNRSHALVKVDALKKTQVTLIRKKVNRAIEKFLNVFGLNVSGRGPNTPTSPEGVVAIGLTLSFLMSAMAFSTHK